MPAIAPPLIVTLVHGTFARGAAWTQPGAAMQAHWPVIAGGPIEFSVFEWSGDNSHVARQAAAAELRSHVRQIAAAHPGQRHVIVAHSHGGNVAISALADAETAGHVHGLACLNTPFIAAAPRNLLPLFLLFLVCNPLAWLMLGAPLVFERAILPNYPGQFMKAVAITAGLTMAAAVPAGIAGFWVFRLTSRWATAIEDLQQRRLTWFTPAEIGSVRVLCATVRRDEAYAYLATLDRLTAAVASGMGVSQWLCLGGAMVYLLAGSGGFLTDFNWFPALTRLSLLLTRVAVGVIGAGALLFIVSLIGTIAAGLLLRGRGYGYGEALTDSLLLAIRVRRHPSTVRAADVRLFDDVVEGGLRHSALYGSRDLVRALAEWADRA